jgi:hypothetical protein
MRFDKRAVQRELDLAAEELERAGHFDLAEKVDYYSNRLMQASADEVPLLRRALSRINIEANRRMRYKDEDTDKKRKARSATLKSRRSSEHRKETLRRRLKEIAARRKQAASRLDNLRDKRRKRVRRDRED